MRKTGGLPGQQLQSVFGWKRCFDRYRIRPEYHAEDQLQAFTEQENDDRFIDIEEPGYPKTDEEAKAAMLALSGCASASEFQRLAKSEREAIFRRLYQEGVNVAQIGRITGYNRKVVYRALGV